MVRTLLLNHCVLNMNTRAPGIAIWEGVIKPVFDMLKLGNFKFFQLPCPEASYLGLKRWWHVREQYDNAMFRRLCRDLAEAMAGILQENEVEEFKLIALGISPSCGYREAQCDPNWGGRPYEVDITKTIKPCKGIWIEELEGVLSPFNYQVHDLSPAMIYPKGRAEHTHLYPKTMEGSIRETAWELGIDVSKLPMDLYLSRETVEEDLRSGRNVIAPLELAWEWDESLVELVESGYGLILIPKSAIWDTSREHFVESLIDQVENQLKVGQQVALIKRPRITSPLYEKFLERMKERNLKDIEYL